jgi:hypothetical protein
VWCSASYNQVWSVPCSFGIVYRFSSRVVVRTEVLNWHDLIMFLGRPQCVDSRMFFRFDYDSVAFIYRCILWTIYTVWLCLYCIRAIQSDPCACSTRNRRSDMVQYACACSTRNRNDVHGGGGLQHAHRRERQDRVEGSASQNQKPASAGDDPGVRGPEVQ